MMLHRHLGTVVVVFFFLHSFMYFYMYICEGSVLHHLSTPFILYGVAGTSIFAVMLLSANRIFRAWSYRLFYAIHIVAAAILLPLLFFHGRYMRIYLIECIIIYGINSILRLWATRRVSATINTVRTSHSTLLDIRIPMTDHTQIWHPGQYALISTRGNPMSRLTGSTPLTIASLASDSEELRLMARVRNGRTKSLAKLDSDISYKFNLEGPYGSQDHISELLRCRKILLIAGGVGGTFILPIYRQLLKDFVARPKKHHLTMHWIARSSLDIAWAVEARNLQEPGFKDNLRVHITQGVPDANRSPDDNSDGDAYTDEKSPSFEAINDPLLMLESSFGRPCIEQMIADTFCEEHGGCTAIVVCGPSKLITHVRKETSAWVRKGRQCYWIAEKFES
jgi:NAD(P)H-flavin reductase